MAMKSFAHCLIAAAICLLCTVQPAIAAGPQAPEEQQAAQTKEKKTVRKILFFGDSMTGWLAEALNAYGHENGFDVATIVWDGSTIAKWGNSPKLPSLISAQKPDAIFISLGMNELFEQNPAKRFAKPMENIIKTVGDIPMVWVGPPSWPGHNKGEALNDWLAQQLGSKSFFRSFDLNLPRQNASNPHPSRAGMIKWVDALMEWAPEHSEVNFPDDIKKPTTQKMVRGKTFIYKRMKESL